MKKEFIGIDVSKNTLDAHLYYLNVHRIFKNTVGGRKELMDWAVESTGFALSDLRFCLEHTGIYSQPLCQLFEDTRTTYYLIPGLELKRSMGVKRGKTDKVDAQRIAQYAFLRRDELIPYTMPDTTVAALKRLIGHRSKLVRQRAGHKVSIKEDKAMYPLAEESIITRSSMMIIASLTDQIKLIEKEIESLVRSHREINKTYVNIKSIKGVGPIVATTMIAYTNNFKAFETWRKFACFAGIAPFENSSGSSYRGKTKVSTLGNRQLKSILSQSAATAILHDPELRIYYNKRLKMGKNKMSTLNIVRNKIVARIFAVANRQTPFVQTFKFAA